MATIYVHAFKTRFGTIRAAASDKALMVLTLPDVSAERFHEILAQSFPTHQFGKANRITLQTEKQVRAYCDGKLRTFTIPTSLNGTPFQTSVLKHVRSITWGTTESYGEVAAKSGFPRASRAVGTVMSTNMVPLIIPCHRVVASAGIGGYGGGLEMKKALLKLEGIRFK